MMNKIVITGASSDIGIAIAKEIISLQDSAILQCSSNLQKLEDLQCFTSRNIKFEQVDFTNDSEVNNFCDTIAETDILINVAGYMEADLLVNLSDEDIQKMISVNIFSFSKICRAVLPYMVAKRKGCIVNISSVAASRGNRGQSVYAGTKGYVESFTRSLAAEYGKRGIRVNGVAPGPIESGKLIKLLRYAEKEVKESTVSNRLGKPEDIAKAVSYLCSEGAAYINGKIIEVDGGFCRGV